MDYSKAKSVISQGLACTRSLVFCDNLQICVKLFKVLPKQTIVCSNFQERHYRCKAHFFCTFANYYLQSFATFCLLFDFLKI